MFDLIIVGVGGQGAILASDIIGKAAVAEGLPVTGAETHGMAQRGGAVENHVRIGCQYGSMIPAGGADCMLSMEPLEALRFAKYLKPSGFVVVNTERIVPVTVYSGKTPYPGAGHDPRRTQGRLQRGKGGGLFGAGQEGGRSTGAECRNDRRRLEVPADKRRDAPAGNREVCAAQDRGGQPEGVRAWQGCLSRQATKSPTPR